MGTNQQILPEVSFKKLGILTEVVLIGQPQAPQGQWVKRILPSCPLKDKVRLPPMEALDLVSRSWVLHCPQLVLVFRLELQLLRNQAVLFHVIRQS